MIFYPPSLLSSSKSKSSTGTGGISAVSYSGTPLGTASQRYWDKKLAPIEAEFKFQFPYDIFQALRKVYETRHNEYWGKPQYIVTNNSARWGEAYYLEPKQPFSLYKFNVDRKGFDYNKAEVVVVGSDIMIDVDYCAIFYDYKELYNFVKKHRR